MENLYQYAYLSCIRPKVSLTCVYEIVQVSRKNNRNANITGILVFDGWRFFQYIEGADDTVLDLVRKLRQDERHHQFTELLSTPFAGPRLFRNWSMGYSVTADETLLTAFTRLTPGEVVLRIPDLVDSVDLEP